VHKALALRSEYESILSLGFFSNGYMVSTVIVTLIIQIAILYVPFINNVLHTTPLAMRDLAVCLILGSTMLPAVEFQKWLYRRRQQTMKP